VRIDNETNEESGSTVA